MIFCRWVLLFRSVSFSLFSHVSITIRSAISAHSFARCFPGSPCQYMSPSPIVACTLFTACYSNVGVFLNRILIDMWNMELDCFTVASSARWYYCRYNHFIFMLQLFVPTHFVVCIRRQNCNSIAWRHLFRKSGIKVSIECKNIHSISAKRTSRFSFVKIAAFEPTIRGSIEIKLSFKVARREGFHYWYFSQFSSLYSRIYVLRMCLLLAFKPLKTIDVAIFLLCLLVVKVKSRSRTKTKQSEKNRPNYNLQCENKTTEK